VSVAGNVPCSCDEWSRSRPDLFLASRFIPAGTAEFGDAGRARCGRGCPRLVLFIVLSLLVVFERYSGILLQRLALVRALYNRRLPKIVAVRCNRR